MSIGSFRCRGSSSGLSLISRLRGPPSPRRRRPTMAAAYCRLLLRRRFPHPHLHPVAATHCPSIDAAGTAALITQSRPSATERVETTVSTLRPDFTSGGNFKHRWYHKSGSSVGAVLIGQAAFFLGLSNSSAFAQEDAVNTSPASEQAEGNDTELLPPRFLVRNEHTVKWYNLRKSGLDFLQKGQLAEAKKLLEESLPEAKKGFGLKNPLVATTLSDLAECYKLKGEYEKAEPLLLESFEIMEESLGCNHILVGDALCSLGIIYTLQDKFAQAQTCYERALKIQGHVLGVGHPKYAEKYAEIMFLLVQLASTSVGLAKSTLQEIRMYAYSASNNLSNMQNINDDAVAYYLASAKQHINDSIRITEGILSPNRAPPTGKIVATTILLEALDAVGLIDVAEHVMMAPGSVLLLKLPLGHLLHGFFKIDVVHITRASPSFIWPGTTSKYVPYTTLRIHFKNGFGKEQDYKTVEDALHKCISLYREPHTRGLLTVTQSVKEGYVFHLGRLILAAEFKLHVEETRELQELHDFSEF
ncbi:hypothetical protein BS78_02G090700 [Paspalum vaginatum]|nr:hypothetical protein BS78_02G090700 [Paspalum vaginatum]